MQESLFGLFDNLLRSYPSSEGRDNIITGSPIHPKLEAWQKVPGDTLYDSDQLDSGGVPVDYPFPARLPAAETLPCRPLGRDSGNSTHLDGRAGHTAHHYGYQ